ncbi:cysteine--tRNA ligase [Candidatus Palauibacter irciniicola]|uniref:cysteine--tRNA ligase n=1 Tax=Candidatus Palauibacter irciniicola TaxID=3056733 RepID=UPI003B02598F
MTLRLYDSLARRLRPFESVEPGRVRMYTCGPTVYDRAHIGNFRAFAWEDLLRRYLRFKGYEVCQVMNLTDVDDRTIAAASARGVPLAEVTDPVIEMFLEDWDTLGLEEPEHRPRATRYVDGMIRLIEALSERGLTYESEGSVYFAIARFPGYGQLAGIDSGGLTATGRAAGDEDYDKDDPRDFVLWKGGDRGGDGAVAVWDSPWGPGRPGWHLECSAMAMHHLGETLDIHTGGVDNLFPHHTNEIAQSEGVTGKTFSKFWLHAEHLLVEGRKMSKSLGNCFTIPELVERGHAPSAIRYLLLSGHYRAQLNFTFDGLEAAAKAVARLHEFRNRAREAGEAETDASTDLGEAAARAGAAFEAAMDDDLNVSEALSAVFGLVREANHLLDAAHPRAPLGTGDALAVIDAFDRVFGVLAVRDRESSGGDDELLQWATGRVGERERARASRDFGRADAIRAELESRGVIVEDLAEFTRLRVGGRTIQVPRPLRTAG